MDSIENASRSFFDILEEKRETPVTFAWTKQALILKLSNAEILHSGELITVQSTGEQRNAHYILTLNSLFVCGTENVESAGEVKEGLIATELKLRNPRLEQIEHKELGL